MCRPYRLFRPCLRFHLYPWSRPRHLSHERSARNKDELSARAKAGAEKAILEHFQPAGEA